MLFIIIAALIIIGIFLVNMRAAQDPDYSAPVPDPSHTVHVIGTLDNNGNTNTGKAESTTGNPEASQNISATIYGNVLVNGGPINAPLNITCYGVKANGEEYRETIASTNGEAWFGIDPGNYRLSCETLQLESSE